MRSKSVLLLVAAALLGLGLVVAACFLARSASGAGISETAQQESYDNLTGCRLLFVGDSITAGFGFDDYNMTWCGMLETDYGMSVTCHSVSGSTIADYNGTKDPMCTRDLPDGSFDIVFLEGGGNDWAMDVPLGDTPDRRDTGTVSGALNILIDRVQAAYPEAQVVFMVPWCDPAQINDLGLSCSDYNAAVKAVCECRGIPYFCGDDPEISGIDAADEQFRTAYFLSSADFWHLNRDGHLLFLPTIAGWLLECRNGFSAG